MTYLFKSNQRIYNPEYYKGQEWPIPKKIEEHFDNIFLGKKQKEIPVDVTEEITDLLNIYVKQIQDAEPQLQQSLESTIWCMRRLIEKYDFIQETKEKMANLKTKCLGACDECEEDLSV